MYTRLTEIFSSASKEVDATKVIDFKTTMFDPANRAHRDCIEAKINHFNKSYNQLLKTDIIIMVPFALNMLLTVGRVLGIGLSTLCCIGICSVLYASDQFQQHRNYQKQFQEQLSELLTIWRTTVKQKGSDISDDQTMLKMLRTIAPFLESEQLINWRPNQTYPDPALSDKFVAIMSTPPHKIPRVMLKGNAPIKAEEVQMSQGSLLRMIANVPASSKWVALYQASMANLNFTLYGQKPKREDHEKENKQKGVLQLIGL